MNNLLIESLIDIEVLLRAPKFKLSADQEHAYRISTAIIAKKLGYKSRAEWNDDLKAEIEQAIKTKEAN